jgi:hypothetical protein
MLGQISPQSGVLAKSFWRLAPEDWQVSMIRRPFGLLDCQRSSLRRRFARFKSSNLQDPQFGRGQ